MTIKGKPGTMLEITHGSIVVDFESQEKYKDVLIICECHIIFSDRADLIIIKEELEKEDEQSDENNDRILSIKNDMLTGMSSFHNATQGRSMSPKSKGHIIDCPIILGSQGDKSSRDQKMQHSSQYPQNIN